MKTQNPLVGRSRKSYGDATFYTLNGENIVRTKPMVVANPNTPAQEAQRVRFKAFTAAANSVSETVLNLLFATKEVGRNRRSMLQNQLAPAYGSQATSDPGLKERFEPTFDVEKLGDIGSGAVGYLGDFVQGAISSGSFTITSQNLEKMKASMVLDGTETHVLIVAISEDGCIIKTSNPVDMGEFDGAIAEGTALQVSGLGDLEEHGSTASCYALGGDQVYLQGFGSFIIKKGKRKTGRGKHNVPV